MPMPLTPGPNRTVEALLQREGFSATAASAWSRSPKPCHDDQVLAEALLWRSKGMDGADAVDWCADGWPAESAAPWHRRGYTLHQANFVERAVTRARSAAAADAAPAHRPDSPAAWRDSDIPPFVVILALATGCHTVEEGRQLAARLAAEPSLRGDLQLRLALGGLDVNALR